MWTAVRSAIIPEGLVSQFADFRRVLRPQYLETWKLLESLMAFI